MAILANAILSISYQGDRPIYVVARTIADGQAWNGSGLEPFDPTHLSTYAINLTNRGGDLQSGALPDALPAGTYQFFFYEQAGSAPDGADYILGTPVSTWNGTTSTDPDPGSPTPGQYALTTLAAVKQLGGITGTASDALLVYLIDAVSSTIETITNRKFLARNYRSRLLLANGRVILPNYPIVRIDTLMIGDVPALTVTYTSTTDISAEIEITDDGDGNASGATLTTMSAAGVPTVTSIDFASCPATSLLAAQIGLVSGWTASAAKNVLTADLKPGTPENALNVAQSLFAPASPLREWNGNQTAGTIDFPSFRGDGQWGRGWNSTPYGIQDPYRHHHHQGLTVCVKYRAGYEVVPFDLGMVAAQAVKNLFISASRDGTVKSKTMGPYQRAYNSSAIYDVLAGQLDQWMKPHIAVGGAQ